MEKLQKISDYLTSAQRFYLTTVDGLTPKSRPIGFHMVVGDKIYFGTGEHKAVYKQMVANPNVEICASIDSGFLRFYGKDAFTTDPTLVEQTFEVMPHLRKMYNEETGLVMTLFYLENATAEFRSMNTIEESYTF